MPGRCFGVWRRRGRWTAFDSDIAGKDGKMPASGMNNPPKRIHPATAPRRASCRNFYEMR